MHGTRDKAKSASKWYTAKDLQRVQRLEDSVNQVTMAVAGNTEIMTALYEYYESLIVNSDWSLAASCAEHSKSFAKQTKNAVYDLKMQSSRATALGRHASERKQMVRCNSLLR